MEMKLAQVQLPAATSSSLKLNGKLIDESGSNPKEGGRDYYCDVCRESLRNIREFVDHQIYHVHERAALRKDRQRLKAKQYSSQFCIQKFDTRSLLNEHQKAHKHEETLSSQTAITDGGRKSSSPSNLVMAAPPPSHVLRGLIKKNLGVQLQSMIHKPSYQPKSHAVFGNTVPMMPRPTPEGNRKLAGGVTSFNTETVFKVSAQYVSAALRFKHEPNHAAAAASCPMRTTKKDHLVGNQQYEDVDLTLKL